MNNKEYGAWVQASARITGRSLRVKMAPERFPGLGSHTQRAKISNPVKPLTYWMQNPPSGVQESVFLKTYPWCL